MMNRSAFTGWIRLAAACALIAFPPNASGRLPQATQALTWPASTPEKQGLDSETLTRIFSIVKERHIAIHSLQVVRNGVLVLDACFYPFEPNLVHDCASVTKSIMSLLIGIAIDQGCIASVDELVVPGFPDRTILHLTEYKRKLSVRSLLTMSSGYSSDPDHDEDLLQEMRGSGDWIQFILDKPVESPPDTRFSYCSINFHLLAGIIKNKTGLSPGEFSRRYLFSPLGIREVIWPSDPAGINFGWGDLHLLPADMAKIGYLCLNKGLWGSTRIVSENWISESTQAHVTIDSDEAYGFGWWIRPWPSPGIYEALGRGGQRIVVWPGRNMVIVFTGGYFEPGEPGRIIVDAVKSDSALPENPRFHDLLRKRIEEAGHPPAPERAQALPAIAGRINGKDFLFTDNPFGFRTVRFDFSGRDQGGLKIVKTNSVLEIPFGLDGVYRRSMTGDFNLPRLARAAWQGENRLVLDLYQVCRMNSEEFSVKFDDDKVTIEREHMRAVGRIR